MKHELKTLGRAIGILLIAPIVGILLLTLVYFIPLDQGKLQAAEDVLYQQNTTGDYPLINAWTQNYYTYRPGVFDGNTAKLIFVYSARSLSGQNPLKLALVEDYPRYWHGYALIMRPLLAIFAYQDLEIFFSYLLLIMAIAIAALIGRRKGLAYSLAFGTSFLLIMPMTVGICTQFLWIALIAYGALLVFLKWDEALCEGNRFVFFFLIIGILTNYLDFLTYPIFTWGIPAVWWLLLEKKERSAKKALSFVVISAVAWACGYVGMWAGKWMVGSIFLQRNLFLDALEQIKFRSGVKDSLSLRERLYVAYKNWKHYSFILYALILGGWLVLYLVHALRYGWRRSKKAPALCLIALSSFVWNMGAANHMEVHHYFTYRIYGVAVMAWLAFVLETMPERRKGAILPKERGKILLSIGVAAVLSFLAMLVTKEETEVSNKAFEGYEQIMFDGGTLEMSLTPRFNRITEVCIALMAEYEDGEYTVRLKDGERSLYEESIPILYMEGLNYKLYPVDWKVKPNHTYRFSVETPENGVYAAFITTGASGMAEVGPVTMNGDVFEGESCMGISYWTRPFSKELKFFWMMTWLGVFSVGSYLWLHGKNRLAEFERRKAE